ncbi:MAG: helix-turn-helix domain-containing protein [Eggerthellaceae bacterium]|nr:helix-turn-helix domain-containing protein [Eggerthellaceae bacterium]
MARSSSYGDILRNARKRTGMNLGDAAYRLRIRPDILRAIEECDYSRMPPRGYTRNMISAYARMLGLNPNEITQMYLDDAYAFEVGRVRKDASTGVGSGASDASSRSSRRQTQATEREPYRNSRGRAVYDDRLEKPSRPSNNARVHTSRNVSLPSRQYTNLVASPKQKGGSSKLPYFIAVGVVVLLLIVIAVFVLGGKDDATVDTQTPNVPVAGLSDTSNPAGTTTPPTIIDVKPTSAVVSFEVASGDSAYIEVYVDEACKYADTANGPVSKEFEITGKCSFVTTNPSSVQLFLDGDLIELTDEDGDGVYVFEVDFAQILADWEAENAKAKAEAAAQQATQDSAKSEGTDTANE